MSTVTEKVKLSKSPDEVAFWEYHFEHPKIWELFEKYALRAIRRNYTKLSGWLIINKIRWEEEVEGGRPFKISNGVIGFYTRLFRYVYPEYARFFKMKPMKGDTNPAEKVGA